MTRRRLSVALVVVVLLGTPWADAAAQTTPAEVAVLRLLAEGGDADAQTKLAFLYETGTGVPQDFTQAWAWYRTAADLGYGLASDILE
jgi:TPR repeat protein